MINYDDFFLGIMVGIFAFFVIVIFAVFTVDGSDCRESVQTWQGECDVGAVVSFEPPDRVVCRCPVKP